MKYTNLHPGVVYYKRKSIDEFDIKTDGSIDNLMLQMIYNSIIVELDGAPDYILEIFNTARYITTLIITEENPMLYFSEYIKIAGKIGAAEGIEHNTFWRYFSSMTLAIVVNYLKAYDNKYLSDKEILVNKICNWHHNKFDNTGRDTEARRLFYDSLLTNDTILMARKYLKEDEFITYNNSTPDNTCCTDEDIDEMFLDNSVSAMKTNQVHETEDKLRSELLEVKDYIQKKDEEIQRLKGELRVYQQEPISDNPHDKVRLEVFCKLLEVSEVDFKKYGTKAEAARLAQMITGLPFSTCRNYMTNRDLNTTKHSEEVLRTNTSIKKLGIKWQL